jgi:pimeloyl-ACP methyl ester carboxylesterase
LDTTDQALAAMAPGPFPVTRPEERDHMSTANVARDMDLLRRAVGDRRMTYVGYSYGTAIGSTYANMFPDKVRAVVIDGVIDPVSYTTGRDGQARRIPSDARLRSEPGAYDTLQAFLRLCDRGGPRCAFSGGDPSGATTGWPGCSASRPSCPTARAAPSHSPTPTWSPPPWG